MAALLPRKPLAVRQSALAPGRAGRSRLEVLPYAAPPGGGGHRPAGGEISSAQMQSHATNQNKRFVHRGQLSERETEGESGRF
ncbi:hypothetical protein AAFF_G00048370 [Aldrovandia affinis]|uniref:Uncharacterized protein n=1 Tax=Aldrovandia affinis TaxID=143900 RepID=A0AAD7S1I5_9TELE|nr:hypothetical protein AAFF_G00048370 [Aldrovandia affinis]